MKTLQGLEWFVEAGVTDISADTPADFIAQSAKPNSAASPASTAPLKMDIAENPVYNPDMARKTATFKEEATSFKTSAVPTGAGKSLAGIIEKARQLADDAKTLDELREAVENFDGLALKKTANKTVFSDGNPKAEVMVIGEAPGADEDREGKPFVGMSGKLLDKVLFSVGLKRTGEKAKDSFYITNTLFWRPPGNRKPTPEELIVCEPFLEKHVALVNPKMIVLFGATAVQGILKDSSSMGKMRKQVFHYKNRYLKHDIPVMVTYHPSFLLRAPMNKKLAWEDMLFLKSQLGL